MIKDPYFFYKYSLRYILLNKFNYLLNTYEFPNINKLVYSFSLSRIDDLDDVQIYNYLYLFKYFFGRRAFLTKQKSFFNIGK